jgi:predicted restriction endonuclease
MGNKNSHAYRSEFSTEILNHWDALSVQGKVWNTKRDQKMRKLIIEHFGRCQACKRDNMRTRNSYIMEGAHIRPKYPDGTYDNSPLNLISLCPTCHTIFDNGLEEDSIKIAHQVQKNYRKIPYLFTDTHLLKRPWYSCCS